MAKSNKQSAKRFTIRSSKGYMIEIVAILILLIPIMLCLVDIAVMVVTAMINDTTCTNIARIASSGEPSEVQERVQAALERSKVDNALISNLRLADGYPKNDDSVSTEPSEVTGPVNGKVTVRIAVDVHPPFLIKHVMQNQSCTMHAEQTFPYTYIRKGTSEVPN
jgi:hypothetical protein